MTRETGFIIFQNKDLIGFWKARCCFLLLVSHENKYMIFGLTNNWNFKAEEVCHSLFTYMYVIPASAVFLLRKHLFQEKTFISREDTYILFFFSKNLKACVNSLGLVTWPFTCWKEFFKLETLFAHGLLVRAG